MTTPKFKVGDTVRKSSHRISLVPEGTEFVVRSVGRSVEFREFHYSGPGADGGVWEDELELVTETSTTEESDSPDPNYGVWVVYERDEYYKPRVLLAFPDELSALRVINNGDYAAQVWVVFLPFDTDIDTIVK